ncbi:MAG: TolB-like translocation protein [Thermoplasmatota archaeon]
MTRRVLAPPGRLLVATAAVGLLLTLLAAPLGQAAGGLPDGFREVAKGSFMEDASDLHGDRLVWASPTTKGTVELRITNVTSRETRVLTTIAGSVGGLTISALDFDGRWVAWIDDRFGNAEAFALDSAGTTLRRLTTTPQDEVAIVVWGGKAIWTLEGTMWLEDLAGGERKKLTAPGAAEVPMCVSGDLLVLGTVNGTGSDLKVRSLSSGSERMLVHVQDQGQENARCDGGLVAFESVQYYNFTTGKPLDLRRIRWMELAGGPMHDVRDLEQRHGRLRGFAAGHVAWTDVTEAGLTTAVHDLAANRTTDLGVDVKFAGLSPPGVAVARQTADGWAVFAMAWDDQGESRGLPGLGFLAVLAATACAFMMARRS